MARIVSYGFILTFLLAATSWASGPTIAPAAENFNFGRIFQGEKVEHTFRFRNVGDEPLRVEKVRTSCGCTAALLSAEVVAPGEEGGVSTSFDSARFRGEIVKTVYLYTDDPTRPVTQFHIRGRVEPEMVLEPERLELGTLQADEAKAARLTVTNRGDNEISFPSVQVTSPDLKAELSSEGLRPGQTIEILVTATPREGRERVSGYVIVKTSSPRVPELRIPVYGTIAVTPGG